MNVSAGMEVSIEYTLRQEDDTIAESNVGGDLLVFVQGSHEILPTLESALERMQAGQAKEVVLPPDEGCGVLGTSAFHEVDKQFAPPYALEVGAQIRGRDQDGHRLQARGRWKPPTSQPRPSRFETSPR